MKTRWLASCVAALLAFGLVFRNLQAVWSSPATAVPKKDSFRLVSDYKALPRQPPQSGGDLLSRWVIVPALPVRAVAVFSPCDQDDSMHPKAADRQAQLKARMARRCNLMSRPLALLSWTMRVCFAFMRVVDMYCGFQILASSCKCA